MSATRTGAGWMLAAAMLAAGAAGGRGQGFEGDDLARLTPGRVRAVNALWIENPLTSQFKTSKRVVVADLKGPAVLTMMHFAMPEALKLDRSVVLRITWDGEPTPSVDVPLVDFFCDPAGTREEVNTAFVNKRRGWNAYFPMPFRASARVELVYDGLLEPGAALWRQMPCYSYVMVRSLDRVPDDVGYFHAAWRKEGLLLGQRDYLALEAKGRGKFVGWNVAVRRPGRDGYPVDMNEKFFIDGEEEASVEFQGIEDSFGFSWGFPPTESQVPLTGFYKFLQGAMGYRFFARDAISFDKSLRVLVGFGKNEDPMFRREFSKAGNELELTSTVYWYQAEPHAPLPALPGAAARAPAPEDPFWPHKEEVPSAAELRQRGVKLHVLCGRKVGPEVVFAEPGYGAKAAGEAWTGWGLPVYHARSGKEAVEVQVQLPPGSRGRLRAYVIDPDQFEGGRKQRVMLAGQDMGVVQGFEQGRWVERQVGAADTKSGTVTVRVTNERKRANAVVSVVEWVGE